MNFKIRKLLTLAVAPPQGTLVAMYFILFVISPADGHSATIRFVITPSDGYSPSADLACKIQEPHKSNTKTGYMCNKNASRNEKKP